MTAERLDIEALAGPEGARSIWPELAAASDNPFATLEYCETWLTHISVDHRLRLFAVRRPDSSVVALLPLVVTAGRYVRKLRFAGFGAANALGPICAHEDQPLGVAALRTAIARTRREWDVFLWQRASPGGWAPSLGGSVVERLGDPVVRRDGRTWEEYLASRSSNLRQELRRKERRLAEQGLEIRLVTAPEELDDALDTLFALHRARWGDAASRWYTGQERFQRAFAHLANERGWLRLRLLELGGRPVAAYHGIRFGSSEWFYQTGRDPSAESSVGFVLVARALREALIDRVPNFRLGPGAQPYKLRLATEDPGLETVAVGRGLRGRAALLAARRKPLT